MSVQQVNTDLGAMGGTTGWHFSITRHARYAPHVSNYVQAHYLDLDFYDRFFKPGAYLRTHAQPMQRWHGEQQEG